MAIEINSVRAKAPSRAQRHGGMHSELARFIASSGYHAALVRSAADDDRFATQLRPLEQFDGHKERVHVDMQDRSDAGQRLLIDGAVDSAESSQIRHVPSLRFSPFVR